MCTTQHLPAPSNAAIFNRSPQHPVVGIASQDVTSNDTLARSKLRKPFDAPTVDRALGDIPKLARELTGAEYAAVTVQESNGRPLRIYHDGMPDDIDWNSQSLPRGRGVLGKLGHADSPLRMKNLSTHPDSYGFPDWHPPCKPCLGFRLRTVPA